MEKLKPILAQKFWILFGVVLILPIVGYFMTKGELAAQIETRWKGLDGTFTGIPSGQDSPNEQWTAGLQLLNDKQKMHNLTANKKLWDVQKVKMRWPEDIASVMNKAEYFKPVPPEQGGSDAQHKYQYDYPREMRRLWEIVDPLDEGKNLRDSDKRRKIAFLMADLHQTNTGRWADLPPTHGDMWDCQEDIWLQTELLQAIARVNANAISQGDAFVKQLGKIQLFGGTKATGDAGAAAPASNVPMPGMEAGAFSGSPMGMGGRPGNAAVSVDINIAEEFVVSNDPNTLSGAGGAGGGMPVTMISSEAAAAAPLTGGAVAGKSDIKRYIDEDENQPFKRRGFSIKVIMDHTKVPDLIAELMNSPFPVEIVRVHQVLLLDSAAPPSGGGSTFLAGGTGGSPFGGFNTTGAIDNSGTLAAAEDSGTGSFSGVGSSGNPMRPGASGTGSLAAMSDPNLAQVAILGVWTLYRPPAPAADAGQPAPGTVVPTPEVATAPAAATQTTTESATTATKPADSETTEVTADAPKKSENGDAPSAEPAKPEKKDPETDADKPAEKKSPSAAESPDKPTDGAK
ncbi:MAG: hypothetical protein IAG10_35165 [Planctomycetaceae bacterium]|nr:hypothetical protein [Planctomycetaceae bacterium]